MEREVYPTDTCTRCGLKRATRALKEKGLAVRLCDDCFWGKEELGPGAEERATG